MADKLPELHAAVRRVLKHHNLTEVGSGVVEADLIQAVLDTVRSGESHPDDLAVDRFAAAMKASKGWKSPSAEAVEWERIARVQDAKLRAVCAEPGGFELLCSVMDKYRKVSSGQASDKALFYQLFLAVACVLVGLWFGMPVGLIRAVSEGEGGYKHPVLLHPVQCTVKDADG